MFLFVCGVYVTLALVLTYPLVVNLRHGVPSDLGDPLLNTWILWWNAHAIPLSDAWWNAPAFYPSQGVLTFSEHLAGLSPITSPIIWLTGNAQLAYNVAFLLSFVLSAVFGYLLGLEVTGRRDAAFIGGLLFGFAPYRIVQAPHLQVLSSYWMPLALVGLHRFRRNRRIRWLVLFGAAWLMQALCNGYYLVYFSVLVACWLGWFLPWRRRRDVLSVAVAWGVAMVPLVPVLLKYRAVHASLGLRRGLSEILEYSADITALLDTSGRLVFWKSLPVFHRPEGELFPGITSMLLIGLGLLMVLWARRRGGAATGAFQGTSMFAFYVLASVLMWGFSLGPSPTYMGRTVLSHAPYGLLLHLPGMDELRVPARFAMVTQLCLSCAAALAFARIAPALARVTRVACAGALVVLALTDTWVASFPVERAPTPWPIQAREDLGPVLELPLGDPMRDLDAMYRAMSTGNPVVNGFSGGYVPPWYGPFQGGLNRHDPALLDHLIQIGVTQVVVDLDADRGGGWRQYLASRSDIRLESSDGRHLLYRLPARR
jgi:MFS family permease